MRRILGVGIDLARVSRFQGMFNRSSHASRRLLERALHPAERESFHALHAQEPQSAFTFLASRWAVKEAAVKAFGSSSLHFPDMQVSAADKETRPQLLVHGSVAERFSEANVVASHLSLSHEEDLATAVVVLEAQDDPVPTQH